MFFYLLIVFPFLKPLILPCLPKFTLRSNFKAKLQTISQTICFFTSVFQIIIPLANLQYFYLSESKFNSSKINYKPTISFPFKILRPRVQRCFGLFYYIYLFFLYISFLLLSTSIYYNMLNMCLLRNKLFIYAHVFDLHKNVMLYRSHVLKVYLYRLMHT